MKPYKKIKQEKQEGGEDQDENFLENIIKEEENFEKSGKNHKKELRQMMYGFGDDNNPLEETTKLLNQYSTEFLIRIAGQAFLRSKRRNRFSNEIKLCDVMYFIQDDLKQQVRAMKKVRAKRKFDEIQQETKVLSKKLEVTNNKKIPNLTPFLE